MDFEKMLVETKLSNEAIDAFTKASRETYGSDSYAAGYLGSMLVRAMNELPRARRKEFREILLNSTEDLGQRLLVK